MEIRNISISLETARLWYKGDDEILKKLSLQAFSKEELESDYESIVDSLILNNKISKNHSVLFVENFSKLLAYNKLMNIALFLNKDWKKEKSKSGFFIYYSESFERFEISSNECFISCNIYFKNENLAKRAIELMGEESLKELFDIND